MVILQGGICVCPGRVECTLRHFKEGQQYTKDDIVILQRWLTQEVLLLKEAGALLSKAGGITCHASIIARELKITALINIDITQLKEGQRAIVDTLEETVELL